MRHLNVHNLTLEFYILLLFPHQDHFISLIVFWRWAIFKIIGPSVQLKLSYVAAFKTETVIFWKFSLIYCTPSVEFRVLRSKVGVFLNLCCYRNYSISTITDIVLFHQIQILHSPWIFVCTLHSCVRTKHWQNNSIISLVTLGNAKVRLRLRR